MATLLLIEDEKVLRENTRDLLKAFGFECLIVENGHQALELLKGFKPDMIICDIMMPGIDGYQTKHEINQDLELMNIPFIFLSGKTAVYDVNYGFALGAGGYVTKPFKIKDLIEVIRENLT